MSSLLRLSYVPPFVDHTEWTRWRSLISLCFDPKLSGRASAMQLGVAAADETWSGVLTLSPDAEDADTAGMRAQFICRGQFVEFVQPSKISSNLEPWRPAIDDFEMFVAGCNPGISEGTQQADEGPR
ncbi:DUF2599 domain-containing protein [Mycobacterium lepromatosis]|uniref:Uncharacterized protein n=1 Tax=Mycobacterium lepromatosis TaxID=480418 RepID=A0A0F4EP17_9MYCO|nr:DUF2599 domain-containing protein [Mycobacterium lepromatosis]KJX74623.1 hypothetical protein MLPM_2452 [Mycobacterium lepromatosis]UKN41663.1 hypothetical protein MLPF_0409 [Mycobacterium lepromatosis]